MHVACWCMLVQSNAIVLSNVADVAVTGAPGSCVRKRARSCSKRALLEHGNACGQAPSHVPCEQGCTRALKAQSLKPKA